MFPVLNSLMSLPLLHSSLCISLLSDTRMLNNYIFLNKSVDAASKRSKACCHSEVPSLDLSGYRFILNGNYLPVATTYRAMLVLSTRTELQAYIAKNTPCNHWWRLPLSTEFIFCNFFKYLWNPLFKITLGLPLVTACTGISKVSWKVFLNITEKNPSASTTIIFGSPNGTKKFPKDHYAAWYDVIYFSPVAVPNPNTVI